MSNSEIAVAKVSTNILLSSGWQAVNRDVGYTPGTLPYLSQHMREAKVTLWLSSYNDAMLSMLKNHFPEDHIIKADAYLR